MITILLHIALLLAPSKPDVCKIYGAMYIVESKAHADYVVFEEDSEAFADLVVFEEDNRLFADHNGIWHFTDDRTFAKHKIYFTKNKDEADFSVAYTETESFAGCQ